MDILGFAWLGVGIIAASVAAIMSGVAWQRAIALALAVGWLIIFFGMAVRITR